MNHLLNAPKILKQILQNHFFRYCKHGKLHSWLICSSSTPSLTSCPLPLFLQPFEHAVKGMVYHGKVTLLVLLKVNMFETWFLKALLNSLWNFNNNSNRAFLLLATTDTRIINILHLVSHLFPTLHLRCRPCVSFLFMYSWALEIPDICLWYTGGSVWLIIT